MGGETGEILHPLSKVKIFNGHEMTCYQHAGAFAVTSSDMAHALTMSHEALLALYMENADRFSDIAATAEVLIATADGPQKTRIFNKQGMRLLTDLAELQILRELVDGPEIKGSVH